MKGILARSGVETPVDAPRRHLIVGAGLMVLTTAMPALSTPTAQLVPRKRGAARENVRDHGARGDGSSDDTAAFQAAIDALPEEGGVVSVPAGKYLIDPTKKIHLRSRMHLKMSDAAVLKTKPNSAERAYVLIAERVSDVEISGGRIVGDREEHLGTTGEWGHGISVRGSKRVTVRGIHISKCWGDGISIGQSIVRRAPYIPSDDVVVANVVCTGNRRQGLSIGASRNIRVYDSEFSYTKGTAPECGIDIEPDKKGLTTCANVHIENCRLHHNNKNGILIYKRVTGVTLRNNTIELNNGYGVYSVSPRVGEIAGNKIQHNYWGGVNLRGGTTDYRVSGNTFRNNHTRLHGLKRSLKPLTPIAGVVRGSRGTGAHIQYSPDSVGIRILVNYYAI